MKFEQSNLFTSGQEGYYTFRIPALTVTSAGTLLAFVETPEDTITNCTFGGPDLRTLYVTCGKLLLSLRTRIPGKASYRPES